MIQAKEIVDLVLTIRTNMAWQHTLLYRDVNDYPINIAAWSAKLTLRSEADSAVVLKTLSTTDATIVLGNGTIILKILTAAEVNAFTWTQAVGHLILTPPGGLPVVFKYLAFVVKPSTTVVP